MPVNPWRRPFEFEGDTRSHEFLYDAGAALKILTAVAFAATLLFAFQGWSGTLAVAAVFLGAWVLWMLALLGEHRARKGLRAVTEDALRPEGGEEEERVERAVQRAEARLGLEILAGLVLVAIVAAVFLMGREMLGLGVLLIFAYLTVFGAPFWIAAMHQRGDDERERLGR